MGFEAQRMGWRRWMALANDPAENSSVYPTTIAGSDNDADEYCSTVQRSVRRTRTEKLSAEAPRGSSKARAEFHTGSLTPACPFSESIPPIHAFVSTGWWQGHLCWP